jgi:UPF0755 protein
MRIRQNRQRVDRLTRLAVVALPLAALCVVALAAVATLTLGTLGAADLNPAERAALAVYLAWRSPDLDQPAGTDATPVLFTVAPGETAATVAGRLAAQHLVTDADLLNYYLRYKGLDQHIQAGNFSLRQTMTLADVAQALTAASARQVTVRLLEGWRLEQTAASLSANPDLAVSEADFLKLAGPGGSRPASYAFLAALPPGASLEGFLYPDTYLLAPGASAADAIDKLLAAFQAHLPAGYEAALASRRLSLFQAVTIASLIEREAVIDDERPLIAAVILNRLAIGQPLEIDATVQYAVGTTGGWWPPVAGLDFRSIASPYNTYYAAGLPAGPIAAPRLSSLLAVAHPAQVNYLYYRARCDGSGRHTFAATYQEQVANACP